MEFTLEIPGYTIVFGAKVRHQIAVSGRVSDGQTGKPISGARVAIIAAPAAFMAKVQLLQTIYGVQWERMAERLDRKRTQADGHFHFLDLPAGAYTLKASLPGTGSRYGEAQTQATVVHDSEGNITIATADLALPPTTLKGKITAPGADPVVMAEVWIRGSGERTFSEGNGDYILTGIETGSRTALVSAQGFQPAAHTVLLNTPGAETILNIEIVPLV